MPPRLRKFALITHITFSVGWLGAVAGFLALAIAGLTSQDAQRVRAAYLAMELTAWFVIVPLAFASLLTGIVQALGTAWGLFRHYWVLAKLLLTAFATVILLLKMKLIGYLAGVAAEMTLSGVDLRALRIELVVHAAGGLLVLLAVTTLSVFKPWGMTAYGRRKVSQADLPSRPRGMLPWCATRYLRPARHAGCAWLGFTPSALPCCLSSCTSPEVACGIIEYGA